MNINSLNRLSLNAFSTSQANKGVKDQGVFNTSDIKFVSVNPEHLKARFVPFMGKGEIEFPLVKCPEASFEKLGGQRQTKEIVKQFTDSITSTKPICQLKQTCLLQGDSLSGKTSLIEALINEVNKYNIPVIRADGGDFTQDNSREKRGDYNGSGPERLANLFWFANKQAEKIPGRTAVIYIENIDGLLPLRSSKDPSSITVNANQVFARFMSEIDAIEKHNYNRVFVVSTSSNSASIDKSAFDRFKTVINVSKPVNKTERRENYQNTHRKT